MHFPTDLAKDQAGNFYIADNSNNVIRKITPGGIISTFAGTGTNGYSGNGGPATSARFFGPFGLAIDGTGNVFVSDFGNNVIREIYASTGKIYTIAGMGVTGFTGDGGPATSAKLYFPRGLALNAGKLYLSDYANFRIRAIDLSTGMINTVADRAPSTPLAGRECQRPRPAFPTSIFWLFAGETSTLPPIT